MATIASVATIIKIIMHYLPQHQLMAKLNSMIDLCNWLSYPKVHFEQMMKMTLFTSIIMMVVIVKAN